MLTTAGEAPMSIVPLKDHGKMTSRSRAKVWSRKLEHLDEKEAPGGGNGLAHRAPCRRLP